MNCPPFQHHINLLLYIYPDDEFDIFKSFFSEDLLSQIIRLRILVYASGFICEALSQVCRAFFKQLIVPIYKENNPKGKGKGSLLCVNRANNVEGNPVLRWLDACAPLPSGGKRQVSNRMYPYAIKVRTVRGLVAVGLRRVSLLHGASWEPVVLSGGSAEPRWSHSGAIVRLGVVEALPTSSASPRKARTDEEMKLFGERSSGSSESVSWE